ncbi:Hypothetical predicted protein [Paramuricea clavata]|uniref:Uncharacterized protein n=1 Tax=Paramuricea clavata TaxID=317549 RepID=A0A7D9I2T2_PARCT|nr:Hypothetical predicted protein [Paramuricea clavata]
MKDMIKDALKKRDFTEDALILAQAATIVRNDIFHHEGFQFTSQYPPGCQKKSLPSSLQCIVSMIVNGPNLAESNDSQVCLTVGQTIVRNVKKRKLNSPKKVRHTREREPPLAIYIGINIYALTRSKKIIQQLYHMGISVSYDRVVQIEEWLATAVCEKFEDDGVVAPTILRKGLFTVGARDNLDRDPSATTATTSFHGTGISIFQIPSTSEPGVIREPVTLPPSRAYTHSLPDHYASVPAVSLKYTHVQVAESNSEPVKLDLTDAKLEECDWMEHSLQHISDVELWKTSSLTWSAYDATQQQPTSELTAICALLPLFYEKSNTPAMIKHGMDIHRQATEYLNPGQIPVITFDQPLFAIAKYVLWKWSDLYGEKVYVVMMCGLHIEKALWNTVGDLLDGSELVTLDSRNCANEAVVNTIRTLEDAGTKKYQDYVKTVLVDRSHSIHDTISNNLLPLFSTKLKVRSKDCKKVKVFENNVALLGQLYISLQNRDGDISEFFAHEVQSYPPSLSEFVKLNLSGTKCHLLQFIKEPNQTEAPYYMTAKFWMVR